MNNYTDDGKENILDVTADGLERLLDPVTQKMKTVSAVAIGIMSIPIFLDVLARFLLDKSLPGIIEIEEFFMVVIVFMALGATHQKEGHISIKLLTDHLSPRIRQALEVFNNLTCTFFFSLMAWQCRLPPLKRPVNTAQCSKSRSACSWEWRRRLVALTLVLLIKTLRAVSATAKTGEWTGLILALTASAVLLSFPVWYATLPFQFSRLSLGGMGMVFMMILLFAGMPIGFAMSIVGFLGMSVISFSITPALMTLGTAPYSTTASFILAVAPLFIFMGLLASEAGISQDLFDTANKWLGRLPGGLAMAAIAGCSGFAAVCGDSMATAVTMGSVALPEMKRKKYSSGLACGSLAAGGTLGILIPPSVGFIFYALVTEESVGKLFVAGIIPGILLTFMFMAAIWCIAVIRPDLAPRERHFPGGKSCCHSRASSGCWSFLLLSWAGFLSVFSAPPKAAASA